MALNLLVCIAIAISLGTRLVSGGSLSDIEHVVIFMQENRSWDTVRFACAMNRLNRAHQIAVFWDYAWSPRLQRSQCTGQLRRKLGLAPVSAGHRSSKRRNWF